MGDKRAPSKIVMSHMRELSINILRRTLDGTHGSLVPFETKHDRQIANMVWTDIVREFAFALSGSWETREEFLDAVKPHKKSSVCIGCGNTFEEQRSDQRYCGKLCRGRVNAKRTYQRRTGKNTQDGTVLPQDDRGFQCPECDGKNLNEDMTVCFDCQAEDYTEEKSDE